MKDVVSSISYCTLVLSKKNKSVFKVHSVDENPDNQQVTSDGKQ